MRFLADKTVVRLARWLRILGYDAALYEGASDRSFLEAARKEGRTALSRKGDLARREFRGMLIIIRNDQVRDQLVEIFERLELKPEADKVFTVCLECNEPLRKISKREIREAVPEYVFSTQEEFRICPKCKKIYWPATHREHALDFLKELFRKE